jgi:predicted dehydrogenase
MPKCLIVGYGRAGKRHAKLAQSLGLEVYAVDPVPDSKVQFASLDEALTEHWDYAVIATPPDQHIEQIIQLADIPILCEKPLCALKQLEDAKWIVDLDTVMVAFNYRWNQNLTHAKTYPGKPPYGWGITSENYRSGGIPAWGLLLDHVSHAVDTVRFMAGSEMHLNGAAHFEGAESEWWDLHGDIGEYTFQIHERLWHEPHDRIATLNCAAGLIEIDAPEAMYRTMWQDFLAGHYDKCNLRSALQTQQILEQASRIAG